MLTISAFEEVNPQVLDVTASTGSDELNNSTEEQKAADDRMKQQISRLLIHDELAEEDPAGERDTMQPTRRARRHFWKNIFTYLTTGGILAVHIGAVYACRFISYKLLSNRDLMSFRR